jgi:hypothetical protein
VTVGVNVGGGVGVAVGVDVGEGVNVAVGVRVGMGDRPNACSNATGVVVGRAGTLRVHAACTMAHNGTISIQSTRRIGSYYAFKAGKHQMATAIAKCQITNDIRGHCPVGALRFAI